MSVDVAMANAYRNKGVLTSDAAEIERYRRILEKDNFQESEPHWRRISKNTVSLFQVLIDNDLTELVLVLKHYPRYIEWVCEHFRYAYSYSEHYADIDAASKLLEISEDFFSKQFVRNLIRKLPPLEDKTLEEINKFSEQLTQNTHTWHPLVINHYKQNILDILDVKESHPLQKIALKKKLKLVPDLQTFEYGAQDRDAFLDIPYMN